MMGNMKIKNILDFYKGVISHSLSIEALDFEISNITDNSKQIVAKNIFVAIVGEKFNGVDFVEDALKKGSIVVVPALYKNKMMGDNIIFVENTRDFLARVIFHLHSEYIPQNILSVSGTNGKSSVSFFVSQYLNHLSIKNMVIGTLGIYIDGKFELECLTTPSPSILCEYFKIAKSKGINYVVMESSSHGIEQHRIDGLNFKALGFTNLTQDHLDYHKTMDNYFKSKVRLYKDFNGTPVINVDDDWGRKLVSLSEKQEIFEYGFKANGNLNSGLKLLEIKKQNISQLVRFLYNNQELELHINLMGEFQVYNILCAMGMLLSCGFDMQKLVNATPLIKQVDGRLNLVLPKIHKDFKVFVDFAHTPNALEEVLKILKKEEHNKLHVVFGCGGDRDKSKRPIMGEIASRYADIIYITDDNPRTENASTIRFEVEAGVVNKEGITVYNVSGRLDAIKKAINSLSKGDILIVAGKGHENYQIIGSEKFHFSDTETILQLLDS
jgi:UDP-N-acetylmuramoyl-L-alanyl-D-glutamate--2,6-diaminopimelate ligase